MFFIVTSFFCKHIHSMKALEDQALEDESGYQEDEVIHINFCELANHFSRVSEVLCLHRM